MPYTLTHFDLIDLMRLFAPSIKKGGACEGITKMWIQTVASDAADLETFYKRLTRVIPPYLERNSLKKIKTDIQALLKQQTNPHTRRPLTLEELDIIEIRSFFENVSLHHNTRDTKVSPDIYQADPLLFSLTASQKLQFHNISIYSNPVGVLAPNLEELCLYFKKLENLLLNYPNEKLSFSFNCGTHVIGTYFNYATKAWHIFDANFNNPILPFTFKLVTDPNKCMDFSTCQILPMTFFSPTRVCKDIIYVEKTPEGVQCILFNPYHKTEFFKIYLPFDASIFPLSYCQDLTSFIIHNTSQLGGPFLPLKEALKSFIFNSLFDRNHPNTLFSVLCHLNGDNPSLFNHLQNIANEFSFSSALKTNTKELTTLQLACCTGQSKSVEALISCKADLNAIHPHYSSPLIMAIKKNYDLIVKILIKAKANPNLLYKGKSPLAIAKQYGRSSISDFLIEVGAKQDVTSRWYAFRVKNTFFSPLEDQRYAMHTVKLLMDLKAIQKANLDILLEKGEASLEERERLKAHFYSNLAQILNDFQEKNHHLAIPFSSTILTQMISYAIYQVFPENIKEMKKRFSLVKTKAYKCVNNSQRRAIYSEQDRQLFSMASLNPILFISRPSLEWSSESKMVPSCALKEDLKKRNSLLFIGAK